MPFITYFCLLLVPCQGALTDLKKLKKKFKNFFKNFFKILWFVFIAKFSIVKKLRVRTN